MKIDWSIVFLIIVVILVIGLPASRGIFVNEDVAYNALKDEGYTNITIIEKDWFAVGLKGCSSDDAAKFTATADNVRNQNVKVYVCSGLIFKSATIRH